MSRDGAPITYLAVARRARVSRTFIYQNVQAKALMATAISRAGNRQHDLQASKDAEIEASWKERALNAEDELRIAHAEIRTQRPVSAPQQGFRLLPESPPGSEYPRIPALWRRSKIRSSSTITPVTRTFMLRPYAAGLICMRQRPSARCRTGYSLSAASRPSGERSGIALLAPACSPVSTRCWPLRSQDRALKCRGASERRRPEVLVSQGKLVRDKIPQIIRADGREPVTYVADAAGYGPGCEKS